MKKLTALLVGAALMMGMAVSLVGATPINFTVHGSDSPGAYLVTKNFISGTKVPVTAVAPDVWASGKWMTFDNPNQSWPMNFGSGSLPGTYSYFTTFDLTGLDPLSAILKGTWASDNGGELYINNLNLGVSTGFSSLTNFDISDGFTSGLNVLKFVVTNEEFGDSPGTNPTGLLVNIETATANPVPEPGTMVLLGFGMLGLAVYGKRRMNNKES